MKKIGIFLLTLATVFTIAGCKKKNKKTTTKDNTTTANNNSYITPDVEGNLLDNGNFNYGEVEMASSGDQLIKTESGGEWWCYALNGGYGEITINDKRQLEVGIIMTSNVMHGVQFAYDGFSITKGSKYVFEFDAFCDIERSFEIRIQQNGGSYENYILEGKSGNLIDKLGTEMKHYKFEFTSAVTDIAPRMALNLGWFEGDPQYKDMPAAILDREAGTISYPHCETITLDNFVLKCTYNSGVVIDPLDLDSRSNVRLNQVGFKTYQTKQAVIRGDISTMPTQVKLVNAETNEEVKKYSVKNTRTNKSSLEFVGIADFSDCTTPGTYYIDAGELGKSSEFVISDNAYDEITSDVIMMLYRQRCGVVLGESGDKFAHSACHQNQAKVISTGEYIDVTGGWHDAGDYGKYVVPGAQTVADLLSAYRYGTNTFTYPSYVTGTDASIPDILEEAMWELDWMLKMQRSDGQVYHKVTSLDFSEKVMPTQDTKEQLVFDTSYAATADFAAVMAMAARILRRDGIATAKANAYEAAAKKAYAALASMQMVSFKNPSLTGINSGEYPDSELYDELAWASIELYSLTGDSSYLTAFNTNFKTTYDLGLGWANVNGYAALEAIDILFEPDDLSDSYKAILNAVLDYADELVDNAKADAYNVTVGTKTVHNEDTGEDTEVYAFEWGSNLTVASNGRILQTAFMIIDEFGNELGLTNEQATAKLEEYYKYYACQINYLLGQNACAYCFVTGYGETSPQNPHHRPSIVANSAMPGMLIGGPDSNFAENGADTVATRSCQGAAPAHCYIDNDNSWSTNEVTIYWNSPLIYLLLTI